MKKRILTVLLAVLVLACALAVTAAAEGESAVAKIGETEYATLEATIKATKTGDTVTLLDDVDLGSKSVGFYNSDATDLTFDLNGHKITSAVANNGTVVASKAGLVIKNGTIENTSDGAKDKKSTSAVYVTNGGTTTLEGVTLISKQSGLYVCQLSSAATVVVNIEEGTSTSDTAYGVYVEAPKGTSSKVPNITLNINGGTVTGTTNGVYAAGPSAAKYGTVKANITGGTVSSVKASTSDNAKSSTEVTISGGKVNGELSLIGSTGTISITGGAFAVRPDQSFCADGYAPVEDEDGTFIVQNAEEVAEVGSVKYSSLKDALDNAEAGQTVKLLANVDFTANGTYVITKDCTLDLNGHKLKLSNHKDEGKFFIANATFTLMDSTDTNKDGTGDGKIYTQTKYSGADTTVTLIQAANGGHFVMESGLIDAASFTNDPANEGQFAVGVYNDQPNSEASATINGGHIKAGWYAIAGNGSKSTDENVVGNITVNGGIVESVADYAIYHPQVGTTTITGGVVSGAAGAIAIRRGELIVSGGTVTSKGQSSTGEWGDGTSGLGNAAIISKSNYGDVNVIVSGGKITAGGDAVILSSSEDGHDSTIAVSGGTFNAAVDDGFCAEGFIPTQNADGTYGVKVSPPVEVWTGYSLLENSSRVACYETLAEAAANLNGKQWILIAKDYTLSADFTIPTEVRVDIKSGATLTVAEGATLTVAADANRLAVLAGGKLEINGTVMVCGTSNLTGKVTLFDGGTLDINKLSVPDGYFLANNGNAYYAGKAYFEIVYSDGTTKKSDSISDLTGATKVTMLADVTDFASTISGKVAQGFILDLDGHTMTGKATATTNVLSINNINVPMTIQNGTIKYASSNTGSGALFTSADVTIASDVTIDGGAGYAIWTDGYGHTLTVNGTVKCDGAYAITSNGSENGGLIADCDITVNAGAKIEAPNGIAIYHPELGTVTINGGTITGHTGIEMCAGKLVVIDGTISSTGDNLDATGSQNAILDGAAISIINRNYPGGVPTAEIKGGTITVTGTGAQTVKAYDYTENTVADWTTAGENVNISGGTFSSIPDNMSALCAAGYVPVQNADGTYTVALDAPTYSITVADAEHGSVTASRRYAERGVTVTITVTPDSGYVLETLTVTDKKGNEIELTDKGDGKYSFRMPGSKVEIKATFTEDNSVLNFFVDVPNDAYFYEPVKWAVENGITVGRTETTFCPADLCTRAEIVTFLWRAAGCPEAKTAVSFTDVDADAYYAAAVAWAVENGITVGTSDTTFSPDDTCTRAQAVTFLWRAEHSPAAGGENPFEDVAAEDYFAGAVAWAVENGVTVGTSDTTFSPTDTCTRAQIVTFLYRLYAEK